MARNNAWSNHRLLSACKALTPEEFAAPRTGFFPSLRATLNHILWVDIYYIDALHRDPTVLQRYNDPDRRTSPTRTSSTTRRRASDRRLIDFCERQTDASLAEGLHPAAAQPHAAAPHVASILEHLFQHQIHHRGQAHAMLASTPVKPPQLDEFFLAGEEDLRRDEHAGCSGLPVR